jgi:hypothetical protein
MKPRDTLRKRVMDSARDSGWVQTAIEDKVPSRWCDPENVHVFLYVYQGVGEPSSRNYPDECNAQLCLCQPCKPQRICTKNYGDETSTTN